MTVREYLSIRPFLTDERIVLWDAAVVANAHDLAEVGRDVLRQHAHAALVGRKARVVIVERQIDHAVGPELGAARDRTADVPTVDDEDVVDVCECRVG